MDSRLSPTSDLNRVVQALRSHPTHTCAGCGQALRPRDPRHTVDGAVFHVECVPTSRGDGASDFEPGEAA